MSPESVVEQFISVTEKAALAAAQTMGFGDNRHSDHVAVEAMRRTLDDIEIAGRVVIGEGERDEAPMLFVGEQVGGLKGEDDAPQVDIAVDPLEGTNLCAHGAPGSVTVMAAAERGGLLHAPDTYMEKIVVGPTARGCVDLDAPVPENLRNIARAFGREVSDLTVVVLERERHQQLIADIRSAGARTRLIPDGDLAAGISAAFGSLPVPRSAGKAVMTPPSPDEAFSSPSTSSAEGSSIVVSSTCVSSESIIARLSFTLGRCAEG